MPMVLGGVGLRSTVRVSRPAHWSSWVDCLPVIHHRHPAVAERLVTELKGGPSTPFLSVAAEAPRALTGVMGFEPPSWHAAALGARPPRRDPEDFGPGTVRQGWQHEATRRVEDLHCGVVHHALRSGASFGPVPGRAWSRCSPDSSPNVQCDIDPFALVQGSSPPSSATTSSHF